MTSHTHNRGSRRQPPARFSRRQCRRSNLQRGQRTVEGIHFPHTRSYKTLTNVVVLGKRTNTRLENQTAGYTLSFGQGAALDGEACAQNSTPLMHVDAAANKTREFHKNKAVVNIPVVGFAAIESRRKYGCFFLQAEDGIRDSDM